MPKSSHLTGFTLIAICLGGCAGPGETVSVNLGAVLTRTKLAPEAKQVVPQPPTGMTADVVAIDAIEPRSSVFNKDRVAAGRALEANRNLAVREFSRALSDRYVREIERDMSRRISALDKTRRDALETVRSELRSAFEIYSIERGALIAELFSIISFPDPNPRSIEPAIPVPPYIQRRLDHVAELRNRVKNLDNAYDEKAKGILASVQHKFDVDLTALAEESAVKRAEAFERADSEARQLAEAQQSQFGPAMLAAKVQLDAVPSRSVVVPGVPAEGPAPAVSRKALTVAERREVLRAQVQVWARSNGYRLESGARDATGEFLQWRKERGL